MISIIIPVYNNPDKLKKALASIKQQTYKEFEVIIVDDGSDKPLTDADLDADLRRQLNIKLYRVNHAGSNAARNYGFSKSRGAYVIFWDADVVGQPEMLEIMLKTLNKHPEAAYAFSSFYYGWKKFKLWPFDAERLKQMPYIHTTSLVRREYFPGWDENIKRLQDWDLWLTMLAQGYTGVFIPRFLFKVTGGGSMSTWLPKFIYQLPWKMKKVREYEQAVEVIKRKHSL